MADTRSVAPLLAEIENALSLLTEFRGQNTQSALTIDPLPSLVEQCRALLYQAHGPQPMRTIHHFACTGGTLIAKALAMQPGTVLLSELDPLSSIRVTKTGKPPFGPSDIILALQHAHRAIPQNVLVDVFIEGVQAAKAGLEAEGLRLVIRDHTHSHYCTEADYTARPTVHDLLSRRMDVLSVVTVRHPVESFTSLAQNNWKHFRPFSLPEYARRYLAFLDGHAGLPIHRYEDFIEAPEAALRQMAKELALPFSPLSLELLMLARLTGDSGRGGDKIALRPPKTVPQWIADHCDDADYMELCKRLGYAPVPAVVDNST